MGRSALKRGLLSIDFGALRVACLWLEISALDIADWAPLTDRFGAFRAGDLIIKSQSGAKIDDKSKGQWVPQFSPSAPTTTSLSTFAVGLSELPLCRRHRGHRELTQWTLPGTKSLPLTSQRLFTPKWACRQVSHPRQKRFPPECLPALKKKPMCKPLGSALVAPLER